MLVIGQHADRWHLSAGSIPIKRQSLQLGLGLELDDLADSNVVHAITGITGGKFRLVERHGVSVCPSPLLEKRGWVVERTSRMGPAPLDPATKVITFISVATHACSAGKALRACRLTFRGNLCHSQRSRTADALPLTQWLDSG